MHSEAWEKTLMNKATRLGLLLISVTATGCLYPSLQTATDTTDAAGGAVAWDGNTAGVDGSSGLSDALGVQSDVPLGGSGGVVGMGGVVGTGGVVRTGGMVGTGGAASPGGVVGAGGASGTGGGAGTGGSDVLPSDGPSVDLHFSSDVPDGMTEIGSHQILSITAGLGHTCAVLDDGIAKCWGYNSSGQLGDGTTAVSTLPLSVGLTDVVAIAAGPQHTCAVQKSGTVSCWGNNAHGQLGNGSKTDSHSPVAVTGVTNALCGSCRWKR